MPKNLDTSSDALPTPPAQAVLTSGLDVDVGGPKYETVDALAARLGIAPMILAAAKACNGWALGRELTETDFTAGINRALGAQMLSK